MMRPVVTKRMPWLVNYGRGTSPMPGSRIAERILCRSTSLPPSAHWYLSSLGGVISLRNLHLDYIGRNATAVAAAGQSALNLESHGFHSLWQRNSKNISILTRFGSIP